MNEISLRPAGPDDGAFLKALFFDVRRPEFAVTGMPDEQLKPLLDMQFMVRSRSFSESFPAARDLIVLFDEEPAGNLLTDHHDNRIHLIDISILASFRGRGIGSVLLEGLKREADVITLTVYALNEPALRLYERHGFSIIGDDGMYKFMEWKNA